MTPSETFRQRKKAEQREERRQAKLQQIRNEQQAALDAKLAQEQRDEERRVAAAARTRELDAALDRAAERRTQLRAAVRARARAEGKAGRVVADRHAAARSAATATAANASRAEQRRRSRRAAASVYARRVAQRHTAGADIRAQRADKTQRRRADAAAARHARAAAVARRWDGAAARRKKAVARPRKAVPATKETAVRPSYAAAVAAAHRKKPRPAAPKPKPPAPKLNRVAPTPPPKRAAPARPKRAAPARPKRAAAQPKKPAGARRREAAAARRRAAALADQRAAKQQLDRIAAARDHLREEAAKASNTSRPAYESSALPWLGTSSNGIVDALGRAVWLRGMSVDVDDATTALPDDALLAAWCADWSANLVRFAYPFALLDGPLGDVALSALDEAVARVAAAGAYALVAMRAPDGAPPGPNAHACWRRIAQRFEDVPSVLFEVWVPPEPVADIWPVAAWTLLAAINDVRPSLCFVPFAAGRDRAPSIPLRFDDGEPVPNVGYALRVDGSSAAWLGDPGFAADAATMPLAVTEWSDGDPMQSTQHQSIMRALYRSALPFCAAAADVGPNATTRFGLTVRRALALENAPQLVPFPRF